MIKKAKFVKLLSALTAIVLSLSVLATLGGCGDISGDGSVNILCSVFPEYDWVRNIVGDSENVKVSLLVGNGQELHGYEASPAEMVQIKQSDIVVSVGGTSDGWISDALKNDAEGVEHIRLTEIDGMTLYNVTSQSLDHMHDESCEHEHDHEHKDGDVDEHVWLSPTNAAVACEYICERICALDPDNAEKYRENTEKYKQSLGELDTRMKAVGSSEHTLLFADRFPFVYLLEDYGIGYYAAFEGCSTDISWTPDTTVTLAKKLDEASEKYVFVTETSDGELARLVINSSQGGGETVTLDSMQSVSEGDVKNKSYIGIMSDNIAVLEGLYLP